MRPSSPLKGFLWQSLFWTPLAAVVFPMLMMGRFSAVSTFISLVIAEVIGTTIVVSIQILRILRKNWFERQQLPFRESRAVYRFLQGFLLLPPSIWLGLKAGQFAGEWVGVRWDRLHWGDWNQSLLWGLISLLIFWVVAVYRDMTEMRQELEKKHLEARLALITSRLNPHFLFNALNSLASLIGTSPQRAEAFTISLSDFYRQVLWAMEKEELPLIDELRLSQAYLAIEQIRFGSRLLTKLPDLQSWPFEGIKVPALCLQPLIENALKHGILPTEEGGAIEIRVEPLPGHLRISVLDDGEGLSPVKAGRGTGTALKNLRERLALYYGGRATLELEERHPQGTSAVLTIPFAEGKS